MAKYNIKIPNVVEAGAEFDGSGFHPIRWIKALIEHSRKRKILKAILKRINEYEKQGYPRNSKIKIGSLPASLTKDEFFSRRKELEQLFGIGHSEYSKRIHQEIDCEQDLIENFFKRNGGIDNFGFISQMFILPKGYSFIRDKKVYIYEKKDRAILMIVDWSIDTYGINGAEPTYNSTCTIKKWLTKNFSIF